MRHEDEDVKHFSKESKSRKPVDAGHEVVRGAIAVLREARGGPMTSVAIFRRGVERGLFEEHQYNTVRARLSQHCDLENARVVRAPGSKVGVRGARTTAWTLAEKGGIQVRRTEDGPVVVALEERASRRRAIPALRILLTDDVIGRKPPQGVRRVAGRTAREALTSDIDPVAVRWLLRNLPLETRFRRRLEALVRDAEGREAIIEAEERRKVRAS